MQNRKRNPREGHRAFSGAKGQNIHRYCTFSKFYVVFPSIKYKAEQKEKQENKIALEECLKKAEEWKDENIKWVTNLFSERYWDIYQDMIDNCYKKYGE